MNGTQQVGQVPRLPNISQQALEAFNLVDSFISRAPLTRGEHQAAQQSLSFLATRFEALEEAERELTKVKAGIPSESAPFIVKTK